jgi:hypothetical protein
MVGMILLAAALSGTPDSTRHRAVVSPESAVFVFPVQYDTAWAIGTPKAPGRTAEYEWTVSTVVRDTVFSFGYLLDSHAAVSAGTLKFTDARARVGDRRLSANGSIDLTVVVDVAFEASQVVVRLNDVAVIRRVFALSPRTVQFSFTVPGRNRETIDVPVEYAGAGVASHISGATSAHQALPLPDSTYLRLVLDLPWLGTFSYSILSRQSTVNVYTRIRDAEVNRCTLSFQIHAEQTAQGAQARPQYFFASTVVIPLDAIDSKSLTIRVQHPQGNSWYEPQRWSLRVVLRPDTKSRIKVSSIESNRRVASRTFDLVVKDYETAELVREWLRDGANRCESWNTAQ